MLLFLLLSHGMSTVRKLNNDTVQECTSHRSYGKRIDVTTQKSHLAIKAMIQIKTFHHTDSVAQLLSS